MPLPHVEPRIAPKLMLAMAANTHITTLQLAETSLRAAQGHQLAESLKQNKTLQLINIEANHIDSESINAVARALEANERTRLETWNFSNQKDIGDYFGRPVEEALAEMLKTNMSLLKLGFSCSDPGCKSNIDKALIRNCALARRRRKSSILPVEEVKATEKLLVVLLLTKPPEVAAWE